jgi:hypothetical protein
MHACDCLAEEFQSYLEMATTNGTLLNKKRGSRIHGTPPATVATRMRQGMHVTSMRTVWQENHPQGNGKMSVCSSFASPRGVLRPPKERSPNPINHSRYPACGYQRHGRGHHVGSDTDTAGKRFLRRRVNRWIQTPDNRLNFRVEKLATSQHRAISGVETLARHFRAYWQRFRSLRGRIGRRTVPSLGPGQSVDFSKR